MGYYLKIIYLVGLVAVINCEPDCSGVSYGTLVPNPHDCNSYYVCQNVPKLERCPLNLHFDSVSRVCNWSYKAQCAEEPHPSSVTNAPQQQTEITTVAHKILAFTSATEKALLPGMPLNSSVPAPPMPELFNIPQPPADGPVSMNKSSNFSLHEEINIKANETFRRNETTGVPSPPMPKDFDEQYTLNSTKVEDKKDKNISKHTVALDKNDKPISKHTDKVQIKKDDDEEKDEKTTEKSKAKKTKGKVNDDKDKFIELPKPPSSSSSEESDENYDLAWICDNILVKSNISKHSAPTDTLGAFNDLSGKKVDPLSTYNPKDVKCLYDGVYFLPHPTNCYDYYICSSKALLTHSCGSGVSWNYLTNQCQIQLLAKCYYNEVGKGKKNQKKKTVFDDDDEKPRVPLPDKPDTGIDFVNDSSAGDSKENLPNCPKDAQVYFPHTEDCRKYYICISGNPVVTTCPDDLYWDDGLKFCSLPQYTPCKVNMDDKE